MLSGRHQPAFASSHHRQVIRQYLVWGAKAQAVLDVVVGFLLVNGKMLAAILKVEHPQMVVEPQLVDSALALHLAVVA